MNRLILLLGVLTALACNSLAADRRNVVSGTMTVAFGWVKDANGVKHSVKGLKLPYTAERITARKLSSHPIPGVPSKQVIPPNKGLSLVGAASPVGTSNVLYAYNVGSLLSALPTYFAQTVYLADTNNNDYGVIETDDPSSLDDMSMQNGSGLPWQNLTFGMDMSAFVSSFWVEWRCWTAYVTGRGHNNQAFDNEFAFFGGPLSSNPGVGTWKITVNVASAGVVAPTDNIYVAQQFREPNLVGEGPFITELKNVYNPAAPPTIGASENFFWYDWDDLNGVYAEDEIDTFGEGTYANLLFGLTTNGTVDNLNPFAYTIKVGSYVSGELIDTWFSDNTRLVGSAAWNTQRGVDPYQIEFDGLAASANVTSLRISMEGSGSIAGGTVRVLLFNYLTNTFDLVDTQSVSSTDTLSEVTITSNPAKYVNSTNRRMKAKVSVNPPANGSRNWNFRIDKLGWTITRP